MKRGHDTRTISGDEYDVFSKWRRIFYWQRGELRRIKRGFNKRARRQARQCAVTQVDEAET